MTTATATPKTKIQDIPLSEISPAPWNKERPVDDAFVRSLREQGQLVTSMVRPAEGGYEIVYGHRRSVGLELAGYETMRCEVRELTDQEAEELGALENAQRRGLDWQQQCGLIEGYLERHQDEDAPARIASALGLTTAQVKRRARMLANLSPKWHEAIKEAKLPAWTADHFELLTIFDEKRQEAIHKEIQYRAGTMTLAELKEEISDSSKALKSAPWDLDDVTLFAKAGACNGCPKRDDAQVDLLGEVVQQGKKGVSCLDEDCFAKKLANYTKRKEAALLEKHPDAVKVGPSWGKAPKDALRPHEVTEAKKGDKGAVPAIQYGDGGKVTLSYVKVKKSAAEKASPKDAAKEAERKRLARIEALALDKLIAIVQDLDTEFTEEAYDALLQYCLVEGLRINIDEEDAEKRIRAFAKKPVTTDELWEVASERMVARVNSAKWALDRGWGQDEGEDLVELVAWMVSADLAELRKEAEAEVDAGPTDAAAEALGDGSAADELDEEEMPEE
jgi:ParB/RepB/Spo0J family partition protein